MPLAAKKNRPAEKVMATGSDPVPFSIVLHRAPTKVVLDMSDALMMRKP